MTTREALHDRIDALPDAVLNRVAQAIDEAAEVPLYTPEDAPYDDEPFTEADREAADRGRASYLRGERTYTTDEVHAMLKQIERGG